jgi:hypothetical protein
MRTTTIGLLAIVLMAVGDFAHAQEAHSMTAKGTFDVTIKPQPADAHSDGVALGRMIIDKVYHGDLEGTAIGQMLTGMGGVKDSAVYVAVERFTGTIHGKKGTLMLHHTGVMDRGRQSLTVAVVPDSGTDQLAGISGTLSVDIKDGKHFYTFAYALAGR